MQQQKSGFTPALLIFLVISQQIGWQGYGQVNRTVVDVVMGYISTNVSQHTGDSSYDAFNTAFSTELNRRWDPAWNVFTIKTTSAFDTVLFGYAFRDQWMWYNDYRVNGVVLSFVVWKDYNCNNNWKTVGKNGAASGFSIRADIANYMPAFSQLNNLWNAAKYYSGTIQANFGRVISVVASQDGASDFYGRICVKDDNYYYTKAEGVSPFTNDGTGPWGNMLFFQTR